MHGRPRAALGAAAAPLGRRAGAAHPSAGRAWRWSPISPRPRPGCFIELGWPVPEIIDLFSVHRVATNGATGVGNSLVAALGHWDCPGLDAGEKDDMRRLILRGGPWDADERAAILDYCQGDVDALGPLLAAMEPVFAKDDAGLAQELLRGEYMAAVAGMERTGIPLDGERLGLILGRREELMARLVVEVDPAYRVFEGSTFKSARFRDYLRREGLPWPTEDDGRLKLDDDTFKDMARRFPQLEPLRQLRKTLSTLRSIKLAAGHDGRARCMLSPLASKTGRNQPSNSRFIFGMPKWMRSLVTPAPGTALAYIDYSTQEVGIAAALSGDEALWDAYCSGDVYLAFAKQAKLAPPDATKESHKAVRDQCKAIVLGVQYGQEAEGMAMKAGISVSMAHELLERHRRTYRRFWEFNRLAVANAMAGYPGDARPRVAHPTGRDDRRVPPQPAQLRQLPRARDRLGDPARGLRRGPPRGPHARRPGP